MATVRGLNFFVWHQVKLHNSTIVWHVYWQPTLDASQFRCVRKQVAATRSATEAEATQFLVLLVELARWPSLGFNQWWDTEGAWRDLFCPTTLSCWSARQPSPPSTISLTLIHKSLTFLWQFLHLWTISPYLWTHAWAALLWWSSYSAWINIYYWGKYPFIFKGYLICCCCCWEPNLYGPP